jgi:nitronate monooxygenase
MARDQPFSREEQVAFLNRMLEAERSGAKALLNILEGSRAAARAWPYCVASTPTRHNCALLGKQIERLGADYSHATSDFLGKLLAVEGRRARVEFLAKGLRWAVKRFDEALPRLDDDARATIASVRESHLRSIERCESVARTMAGDAPR